MREIVKIENVKLDRELKATDLELVEILLYDYEEECVVEEETWYALKEETLLDYYRAINKEELAKGLVSFAWDIKDSKNRVVIYTDFETQKLGVSFVIEPFGLGYKYPQLHHHIHHIVLGELTFKNYNSKEEAIADYKNIVMDYTDDFEEHLAEMYEYTPVKW